MRRKLIPGFKFRDGKLMIFTDEEVRVVHAWPEMEAVRKRATERRWETFIPCFRLLRPKTPLDPAASEAVLGPEGISSPGLDPAWEKARAFALFGYAIPVDIARSVEPFTNRQWRLLEMCRHRELARDLLVQTPALGYCVAHHRSFRSGFSRGGATAARASEMKQREMMRWLGFPDSQSWVKTLAKIQHSAISVRSLVALHDVSGLEGVQKQLQHVPTINEGVLAVVVQPQISELVAPSLLAEIAQTGEVNAAQPLGDILELRRRLNLQNRLSPFRSVDQLRRKEQEMTEEYMRFMARQEEARLERLRKEEADLECLPEPPLPGTRDIEPIRFASELRAEGQAQHNCVGTYATRVHSGACYIYRILAPERATLSIHKGADGCWKIGQLKSDGNQPVSADTMRIVQTWLDQYSFSVA